MVSTVERGAGLQVEQFASGESRREDILAAAIRCFAARGFHGTSTREIAREAGAKHSLLFYHFHSKADLYRASVVDQLEQLAVQIDAALASATDPVSRLRRFVEVYYECFTAREPGLSVCLRELSGLPTGLAHQISDAHQRHSMGVLQEIIATGMREGVFRPLDAGACAFAITGILHAFLRMRPSTRERFDPNEAVRQVLDVYGAGLLATPLASVGSKVVST
jgi:AcrR family transcriptional regulator